MENDFRLKVIILIHAMGGFICPGIAFANSLDPDQAQPNVGLYLRSKLFANLIPFQQNEENVLKIFLDNVYHTHITSHAKR